MRELFINKSGLLVKEVAQPLLSASSLVIEIYYTYVSAQLEPANVPALTTLINNMPHKVKNLFETVLSFSANNLQQSLLSRAYPCSGQVISVGKKVAKFKPGDWITGFNPFYGTQGNLAIVPEDYVVAVNNANLLPVATLVPFAGYALHLLRTARIQLGEKIVFIGVDIIALLAMQFAKASGCMVIAIDNDQGLLDLASALGADFCFHTSYENICKEIMIISEGNGIDAGFITRKQELLYDEFISTIRYNGKLVIAQGGIDILKDITVTHNVHIDIVHNVNEPSFESIQRWGLNNNMRAAMDFIEKNTITLSPILGDPINISQLASAYDRVQKKLSVGFLLQYQQVAQEVKGGLHCKAEEKLIQQKSISHFKGATAGLHIGVVGITDLFLSNAMPVLKKRSHDIYGFFEEDSQRSDQLLRRYSQAQWFLLDDLLQNELCDIIVIGSGHTSHTDHALQALRNGKAVFLEKPMVTSYAQLDELFGFLKNNPYARFTVGYGFSFSSFIQKIKKIIDDRKTPLMITYRSNKEVVYTQRRVGNIMSAGRIIGDMCEIIDLICYLTGSTPRSVSVEAMHVARDDIYPTDNVSTQITFSDGSIAVFCYTTLGHAGIGADRLELYFDGKAILLDDYMELYGFGLPSWFNETCTTSDKGFSVLLNKFLNELNHETYEPPLAFNRLYMVAQLTLLIDQLACEGGGKKEL